MPTNPKTAIIKEVYDGDNSPEVFEQELEKALDNDCEIIIIEPARLGDETAHWIKFGNVLHKIAVYSGISSICISKFYTFAHRIKNFKYFSDERYSYFLRCYILSQSKLLDCLHSIDGY